VTCLVFMLCMLTSVVEISVELDTYGTEDFEACNNMHLSICKAGSVGSSRADHAWKEISSLLSGTYGCLASTCYSCVTYDGDGSTVLTTSVLRR